MMVWTDAAEAGILERIEAAIAETEKELHAYIKAHGGFPEIEIACSRNGSKVSRFRLRRPEQIASSAEAVRQICLT
jgi:hypothetical protein